MDVSVDTTLFARAFVTLIVVMDPLGNIPIFLALTRTQTGDQRVRSGRQATLVAGSLILGFALFGDQILLLLGISVEALQVSGGLLLALVSLELLRSAGPELGTSATDANVALVPLGTPLLAGPGAIAATMLFIRDADGAGDTALVVLALVAALALVYLALRFAAAVARVVRESVIQLLSRVVGLLLAAIAVQLVATGIESWVRSGV